MELRGDPHGSSDHRKTSLLIPGCLAAGGEKRADDHRQNRVKQRRSTTEHFRKKRRKKSRLQRHLNCKTLANLINFYQNSQHKIT